MAQLLIISPQGSEQLVTLERSEYILGRDDNVDIQIKDKKASRKHARIVKKGGGYWLEDLGSANGVMVDGRPLTIPVQLTTGVSFQVGGHTLQLAAETIAETTRFALQGLTPPFLNQSFMLPSGELLVGRVDGNAIVIPDVSISRHHALLRVSPSGATVVDKESSNGCWVNGNRITEEKSLQPGDYVRFGNVEFVFLVPISPNMSCFARVVHQLMQTRRSVRLGAGLGLIALLIISIVVLAVMRSPPPGSKGPQSLEAAYERAIQNDLQAARGHSTAIAWAEAERAYKRVLDRDPINREARRGLAEAKDNLRDQETLNAARTALDTGQPADALAKLRSIRSDARYATEANELASRAREVIATSALELAEKYCRKEEWRDCHRHAVRVVEHAPQSEPGMELINKAERAMRAQKTPFPPWVPTRADSTDHLPSIAARYADDEVRYAVMRYVAGDLETAIKRVRAFADRPGAQSLLAALTEFRNHQTAGDGAAAAGAMDRAVEAWKKALESDAAIVPENHPSALREDVRMSLSAELFKQGDAAFSRGQHTVALQLWNTGLKHNPGDSKLLAGMAKLEAAAAAALEGIPTRGTLRRDACSKLADIIETTRPDSSTHEEAKRRQSNCR